MNNEIYIVLWIVYTIISFLVFITVTIKILANKDYTEKGEYKYLPFDEEEIKEIKRRKRSEPE